ncbi:MAG: hypothetical protein VX000_01760, partial [Myxococcota bacterium]|nr:hypothetical protein [Myxococcota bacterium]
MSNQPSPAHAPPGTEGFLDGFLPRMTANAVAMAGVAALTWWMVDDRASEQAHSLEAARAEAALLRFERDRMQALSQELAREVHDAGMEAEIAHWQLRWTEERLRRLEAEGSDGNAAPRVRAASRIEPLDAPAAAFLAEQVDALVAQADHRSEAPEPAGGSGAEPDAGVSPLGGGFEAQPFDARIPALRAASGQRDRDRALAAWKQVVEEVVVAECGGRFSQAGRWRCE